MEIEESGFKFVFPEGSAVVKFDDTAFYRKLFNAMPDSKGVDFIANTKEYIAFIEVKNCTGDEGNCRWRIAPDNAKKETTHTQVNIEGRDSLDIEVAQKTAMTLAALVGARSFGERSQNTAELKEIQKAIFADNFTGNKKKKLVILFLEGNFGSRTRTKKMIMQNLQRSMNTKLKWFDCRVSVVDSNTYNEQIFNTNRQGVPRF